MCLSSGELYKKIPKSGSESTDKINSFTSMFLQGSRPTRNIYCLGDTGMGKTALCAYLTSLWCKCQASSAGETGVITAENVSFTDWHCFKDFDFLFFLDLSEARGKICDIENMIKFQILEELRSVGLYNEEFLARILDHKRCLIIMDALDEWYHPAHTGCKRLNWTIPHRKLWENCTILTTMRPWKMSQIKLNENEADVKIEVKGIENSRLFVENIIKCLNDKTGQSKIAEDFERTVQEKGLKHLVNIPIVAMQLICLWYEEHDLGRSKTAVYSNMLDMLFSRRQEQLPVFPEHSGADLPSCLKSTECCRSYSGFLKQLGNLAFRTLISPENNLTTVFEQTLSSPEKQLALDIGVVSQNRSISLVSNRPKTSFLHKTFQEFLSAVYVGMTSESDKVIDDMFMFYGERNDIFDISELFAFVCGTNPNMAWKMSVRIMSCLQYRDRFSDTFKHVLNVQQPVREFQRMIIDGYSESVSNGYTDTRLALPHAEMNKCNIFSHLTDEDRRLLKSLLIQNKGHMKTLAFHVNNIEQEIGESPSSLVQASQHTLETVILQYVWCGKVDLSDCKKLERLYLLQVKNLELHIHKNIIVCQMAGVHISIQETVLKTLSGGAPRLDTLLVCGVAKEHVGLLCQVIANSPNLKNIEISRTDLDQNLELPPSVDFILLSEVATSSSCCNNLLASLRCLSRPVRGAFSNCTVSGNISSVTNFVEESGFNVSKCEVRNGQLTLEFGMTYIYCRKAHQL